MKKREYRRKKRTRIRLMVYGLTAYAMALPVAWLSVKLLSDAETVTAFTNQEMKNQVRMAAAEEIPDGKEKAYQLRTDRYVITLKTKDDVLAVLENQKEPYDTEDAFEIVVTQHEGEAQAVADIRPKAEPDAAGEETADMDMNFMDEIAVRETFAAPETIMTVESAEEKLSNIKDSGLEVVVVRQEEYRQHYEEEPVYIEDDTIKKGIEEIVEPGAEGSVLVTARVEYKNGVEWKRSVLNKKIVEAAKPKVIRRGTKDPYEFLRPIVGGRKTSGYGKRWGRLHKGVDWGVPRGTSVMAAKSGTVLSAGRNGSYGISILLEHGNGVRTRYAHLSKLLVKAGDTVEQGQVIAKSGNTGRSTGPHLHFEILLNNKPVNPLQFVAE